MTATDFMKSLISEIVSRAERLSWEVSRDERLERLTALESATLLKALQEGPSNELFEPPENRVALLLRRSFRLLVVAYDEQVDLLGTCRSALWWAGLVRGSLQPTSRADLHLFIVATPAAGEEEGLLRDRSRIEADERICRKHVWLPGIDADASDFLDSTFLAHPWKRDALEPQSLDPLQRLAETAGLAPQLASKWIGALSTLDDVKGETLAAVLSDLHEAPDEE